VLTFRIIESDQPHALAAAFTFGREDVIPDIVPSPRARSAPALPGQLDVHHLDRHIQLDEVHTPLARFARPVRRLSPALG
jgi:hypothetical protein